MTKVKSSYYITTIKWINDVKSLQKMYPKLSKGYFFRDTFYVTAVWEGNVDGCNETGLKEKY